MEDIFSAVREFRRMVDDEVLDQRVQLLTDPSKTLPQAWKQLLEFEKADAGICKFAQIFEDALHLFYQMFQENGAFE